MMRLDLVHERLDDRQRDVGLEQGHAHLAQGVSDVVLGQPTAATEAFDDGCQASGKLVEHAGGSLGRVADARKGTDAEVGDYRA
jgi:2-keto-4-pentenoate hydratase